MDTFDKVETPWGSWQIVYHSLDNVVKILTVNAGCMLSLQKHMKRNESWIPMENGLIAYTYRPHTSLGDLSAMTGSTLVKPLYADEVFNVGRGVIHRLINPTHKPIQMTEIIRGTYHEQDIVRIHDAYGRE